MMQWLSVSLPVGTCEPKGKVVNFPVNLCSMINDVH